MLSKYKIKIINGAMRNRELQLPPGNVTIGTENNDIVHFPLEQGIVNFSLDTRDASVFLLYHGTFWIEGKPENSTGEHLLPEGKVIDVAGCAFILGDADQNIALHEVPTRFSQKQRSKKRVLVAGTLLFASIAVATVTSYFLLVNHKTEAIPINRQDVYQQLKEAGLNAITLVWHGKNVAVYGRCKKSTELNIFFNYLKNVDINFINNALCDDLVISSIKDVLEQFGYDDISVSAGEKPGFFTLRGYILPSSQWNEVEKLLLNTPGVVGWDIRHDNNIALDNVITMLRDNNLINYFSVIKKNDVIVISGSVSKEVERNILSLVNAFNNKEKNVHVLFQNIQTYIPTDLFPAKILRVSGTSNNPAIVLDNGTSLSIGSILKGGYVIDSIDPASGINLSRPDEYIHIPLSY
ncbi:EscD/YscD/HrpQ family type III secretion system inner membrane ring protein [Salmonella enterica subsp. salamae]|nr:EscD/YscD/HrpQ family type III secretion system inner membrane ring protein [Salmonella enterica subsp. salamae serovar Sofia]ECJ2394631.1 EscD/YscD/HrpQ family type III secretion system inner membrane ring protein [Salmonella enterica subsp. salamae]